MITDKDTLRNLVVRHLEQACGLRPGETNRIQLSDFDSIAGTLLLTLGMDNDTEQYTERLEFFTVDALLLWLSVRGREPGRLFQVE